MESLPISNPFPGAASFLVRETDSTQNEAKRLAGLGLPAGSLVAAECQRAGRGRMPERRWDSEPGSNLLFTIRLAPEAAQLPALPLRIGAALCRAAAIQAIRMGIALNSRAPRLKWPNDLLFGTRKAAGILCEAGPQGVFAGIGINCNQRAFPGDLAAKATSLCLELEAEIDRWAFLELLLGVLKAELSDPDWKPGVEEILWRRGEAVSFRPGLPGSSELVRGRLEGIDAVGALLIRSQGTAPSELLAFAAGELLLS